MHLSVLLLRFEIHIISNRKSIYAFRVFSVWRGAELCKYRV